MIPIQLADILARLDHFSEVWRSDTSDEQRTVLAGLDELLGRLDGTEPATAGQAERIDELRGRIEVLMDEIEISLGIEPPAFYSPEDLENGLDERPWLTTALAQPPITAQSVQL
jgi:hypothetical protein